MLRDRYAPVDLFALAPALTLEFEPVLARLDVLPDDDVLVRAVRDDLARRYPRTRVTGRPSTPVEVLLRMLIVRRLYGWSYAETERFVGDSLVLRQFCRLGLERAPDDTTLLRWAGLIRPATPDALLDHVVALARRLQVTRGRGAGRGAGRVPDADPQRPPAAAADPPPGAAQGRGRGAGATEPVRPPPARPRLPPPRRRGRLQPRRPLRRVVPVPLPLQLPNPRLQPRDQRPLLRDGRLQPIDDFRLADHQVHQLRMRQRPDDRPFQRHARQRTRPAPPSVKSAPAPLPPHEPEQLPALWGCRHLWRWVV
jgi:hypothetical protein